MAGFRYPEERVFLRRTAIIAAAGVAGAAAYLGLSALDQPDDDEFVTLFGVTTIGPTTTISDPTTTTTSSSTTTTTTAPQRMPTSTIGTTSTSTIVASAGPAPTEQPTTTDPPIFTPATTSPEAGPAPVVAIFDVETITLAGAVPSQAAADRLTALAHANSKTPATVINLLRIDPTVPGNVGVRVIELNSTRFPTGLPEITPEHAAELQRMVTFMKALPAVTVTVVGHADQHGTDADNLALSRARAQAVVQFMIDQGIEPDRLTAEAVGESDLLSPEDDQAALALNRRTEFVIYGALLDA
jgi:outer membrane protein OmpA-like peptidoglycan-associated protein